MGEEKVHAYFGQPLAPPEDGSVALLWASHDAPPKTTVEEAKLGRVTEEEWEKVKQDLLFHHLGWGENCQQMVDDDFSTLGLSLPRKGGDQNCCLVLLGC